MRDRLGAVGDRENKLPRQTYFRRRAADAAGDVAQHVAEHNVLAAEYVAFADAAPVQGRDVTRSDVVDMDQIEPGIDIGGHAPRRRLDDDPSGRRRTNVARPDRRRWVDDDRR